MNLLLESKRDNLLLPYYNLLLSKGLNISFGEFKGILLEHLTQNAGIRNLSLASNYYLAGAARYYFNGDLTENKDLALFYNYTTNNVRTQQANNNQAVSQNHQDKFIPEVCMALNVLIKILRDSYIDTIGTTFEQPEDFGELSLKQLFKKYGAKIKKQLGMEEKPEESTLDKSTSVGNGYTFEILYSFDQAKKYEEYTKPGAWCITYGEGHYNSYIRNLNIHYVIFRQNGFENIERIPEKKKWKPCSNGYKKPQDTFGNSLIAVLQSNNSWQPIYITSRWNHGSNDTGSVEADHAYTTAEFMKITGVNQADLERIYQIWAEEVNNNKSRNELNKIKKDTLLNIKEAQLRINNGENITSLIDIIHFAVGSVENIKKSVFIGELKGTSARFIVDKSKIVFESIGDINTTYSTGNRSGMIFAFNYLIICRFENYFLLYDYRQHKIVSVNDVYKFKAIPVPFYSKQNEFNYSFYQVKTSHKDIALIDINTNKPLQLPNGEYWFNSMFSQTANSRWTPRNKVTALFVADTSCSALEIIYDESSREKYFYNLTTRKFFNPPVFDGDESLLPQLNRFNKLEPILDNSNLGKNFIIFRFTSNPNARWDTYCTPLQLYTTDGNEVILDGTKYFKNLVYLGYNFLGYEKFEGNDTSWLRVKKYKIFDFQNNTTITIGGRAIIADGFKGSYDSDADDYRTVICDAFRAEGSFILDKKMRKLVKNNYNYPDENTFCYFSHNKLCTAIICYKNQDGYEYNDEAMAKKTFILDLDHQCTYEAKKFDYWLQNDKKDIFNIKPIEYIEE